MRTLEVSSVCLRTADSVLFGGYITTLSIIQVGYSRNFTMNYHRSCLVF
jgi:hypothetical protein